MKVKLKNLQDLLSDLLLFLYTRFSVAFSEDENNVICELMLLTRVTSLLGLKKSSKFPPPIAYLTPN